MNNESGAVGGAQQRAFVRKAAEYYTDTMKEGLGACAVTVASAGRGETKREQRPG